MFCVTVPKKNTLAIESFLNEVIALRPYRPETLLKTAASVFLGIFLNFQEQMFCRTPLFHGLTASSIGEIPLLNGTVIFLLKKQSS